MKTIKIFTLLTALFFVLFINGCSGTKVSTTSGKLEGIEWKLESLNGKTVALKSGSSITLSFEGTTAKIGGTAVCNKYFGGYTKTDETVVFSAIGSTKMMCDDNINESDYFSMLGSVDSYKISGGKLTLIGKDKILAVYTK
jgi:heat shock protein HslJ